MVISYSSVSLPEGTGTCISLNTIWELEWNWILNYCLKDTGEIIPFYILTYFHMISSWLPRSGCRLSLSQKKKKIYLFAGSFLIWLVLSRTTPVLKFFLTVTQAVHHNICELNRVGVKLLDKRQPTECFFSPNVEYSHVPLYPPMFFVRLYLIILSKYILPLYPPIILSHYIIFQ